MESIGLTFAMPALDRSVDFDPVAHWHDLYVRTNLDCDSWIEEVRDAFRGLVGRLPAPAARSREESLPVRRGGGDAPPRR